MERYYFRIKAQNNTTALALETEEGVPGQRTWVAYGIYEGPGNRFLPRIYKKEHHVRLLKGRITGDKLKLFKSPSLWSFVLAVS